MPSSYDELSSEEQLVVRAEWAKRIEERRAALDLAGQFTAHGRSWVELDDEGQVIERGPCGPLEPSAQARGGYRLR